MHNNYFFLSQLSNTLHQLLSGATLLVCFRQNKDELVIEFQLKNGKSFYLQASLGDHFSCLYFPETFNRAKQNTIDLFTELKGALLLKVIQVENERAFILQFQNNHSLLFKLFGNRANIILYQGSNLISIFKGRLQQDLSIKLEALSRTMDLSLEHLESQSWNLKKEFFTLGDLGLKYLQQLGFDTKLSEEKFILLSNVLKELNKPGFSIVRIDGKVHLSMLEVGEKLNLFTDPIAAVNSFYHAHFRYNHSVDLKRTLVSVIEKRIHDSAVFVTNSTARLSEISNGTTPGQIADVIMANLHAIPSNAASVTLENFYNQNTPLEIKLKRQVTPQKLAEQLYRKQKNRHVEIENIEKTLLSTHAKIKSLEEQKESLASMQDYKALQQFTKNLQLLAPKKATENSPKFKTCEFMGYTILIGRNAGNNDELTQKFAHKDDLWLHAKDVTGSHVVIKQQPGKPFPKPVIERAASMAAFYSKRKNDSLCPVMYTLKKYVRKVKGAPKGAVKVEKEKIMMVVPSDM